MATFYGGSGNDSNAGSTSNDISYGGAGNDTLLGNAGIDTLVGGSGNDSLDGGTGDDQIVGGTGNDTIYGSWGNDSIVSDGRWYDPYAFRSTTGGTATTIYVTNNADGPIDLWYNDVNGNMQYVATIAPGQTFAYDTTTTSNFFLRDPDGYFLDYIPGGTQTFSYNPPLADVVYGGGDQDFIQAQYGNDTIYGDDGHDTIYGGYGNDSLDGGIGNDHVYGDAGDDWLAGAAGADTLDGGVGNDTIDGGSDRDSILGGDGNDLVYGGSGDDYADLGAGDDSFGSWLTDETGNDTVYGGAGNDEIIGGNDTDLLYGGTDNDTLSGGGGSDSIYGGTGDDIGLVTDDHNQDYYDLGENTGDADELVFANYASTNGVNVTFTGQDAGSYAYTGGYATGSFVGVEQISGTEYADTLNAASDNDGVTLWGNGGADSILGGSGNDLLDGGAGNDTIYFGDGADEVYGGDGDDQIDDSSVALVTGASYVDGGAGNDTVWSGGGNDTVLGGAGNDQISGEANDDMVYGGDGQDTLFGDTGNDTVYGGLGGDVMYGGAGDDRLDLTDADSAADYAYGGVGNDTLVSRIDLDGGSDTLYGGDDRDVFIAGAGDRIEGGEGGIDWDIIDLSSIPIGATITLTGAGAGTITGSGSTLTFIEIEQIQGSELADTVYGAGDPVGMTYWMGAGDDSIIGGSGAETIHGGIGNDQIYGGDGADHVNADDGQDTVYGGAGNDTLNGDAGNDLLIGDDGNDLLLTGTGDDSAYGGLGDDYLSDITGNSLLDAGAGNDSLFGGDGKDTLIGGAGNDSLSGGTGADEFVLTAAGGNDTITDFDMSLLAGQTSDQLDVSGLQNPDASPVKVWDVVIAGDGAGNTLLTFPQGESVLLQGVDPSLVGSAGMLAAMGVPCFVAGTRIATPGGPRAVETLQVGDLVNLAKGGAAPILWRGARSLQAAALAEREGLLPIRIRAGSHGALRDLMLSPQHAVEVRRADGNRALVRAGHLARLNWGARLARGVRSVVYHHLLLPEHAIILADGVPVESLYPGRLALAGFLPADRASLSLALTGHCPKAPGQTLTEAYGPRCLPLLGFAAACRWQAERATLTAA